MKGYFYILSLNNSSRYYLGSTNDIDRRMSEHNRGHSPFTKNFLPVKIIYQKEFLSLLEARKVERKLKKLKSRKKIDEIIKYGRIVF